MCHWKGKSNQQQQLDPCRTCTGYAPATGHTVCDACAPVPDAGGARAAAVCRGCRPSRILCASCTICPAGEYADPCGRHRNGRSDTVCSSPPDVLSGSAVPCTPNSSRRSNASGLPLQDGYHRVGDECVECGFDAYCFDDQQFQCPDYSFTHGTTSSHRLDCQCRRGHYRDPVNDEINFECAQCREDDWCFNNTHNNCTDDRMSSPAGSFHISNCTCDDGFYNNEADTECIVCPADHYCFDGRQFACAADRWTQGANNRHDAADCVCRPGTQGATASHVDPGAAAVMPSCAPCPMILTAWARTTLPPLPLQLDDRWHGRRRAPTVRARQDSSLSTAPRSPMSALECPSGDFKTDTGNVACDVCSYCSASFPTHVFTQELCNIKEDAV